MAKKFSAQQAGLLIAAIVATLVWLFARPVALPIIFLNTHVHEMCHALAAKLTGGEVLSIAVLSDGSGTTLTSGGWEWLIACAGYVGAAAIGGAMIRVSCREGFARACLVALMVLLLMELALWLRSDVTGISTNVVLISLLGLSLRFVRGLRLQLLVEAIGIIFTIASYESLSALWTLSRTTEAQTDAVLMQKLTGLPASLWAGMWAGTASLILFATVRATWMGKKVGKYAQS